jgi:cytochrome c peroxidase
MRPRTVRSVAFASLLATSLAARLVAQGGGPPLPPPGVPPPPVPLGNPITPTKALLGKALFWDEQLSATRTTACATCHVPANGGSDPRSFGPGSVHPGLDGIFGTPDDKRGSRGVANSEADGDWVSVPFFGLAEQVTTRKAPSMINAVYSPLLFWDGRAGPNFVDPVTGAVVLPQQGALEAQAAAPPVSAVEMGHLGATWTELVAEIGTLEPLALAENVPADLANFVAGHNYAELFQQAFGTSGVSATRALLAIGTYERTLISGQSAWDDFLAGNQAALTPQQQQGRAIYFGQGNCAACHGGQLLTNNTFRNIGVRPIPEDVGRGAITGNPADNGRFKVPSLRNVALRAPYFHNGQAQDLLAVVDFYNRGGDFFVNQDPLIQPLGLSLQQRQALVAFLQSFTDPRVANETAPFDRPRLYTETAHVPVALGTPTSGSGGFAPRMFATEPPQLGNPNLTLAVDRALGGAPVFLVIDPVVVPGGWNLLGAQIYPALSPAVSLFPMGATSGAGAGNGFESRGFALPVDAGLAGSVLVAQWVIADVGASGGVAASAAAQVALY